MRRFFRRLRQIRKSAELIVELLALWPEFDMVLDDARDEPVVIEVREIIGELRAIW